jgi:hypothetical protein
MGTMNSHREIAIRIFDQIRQAFPQLQMEVRLDHPHLDAAMHIPCQVGLAFAVDLNLQNEDELHLSVGGLWVSWFPCDHPENVRRFLASVSGILSGEYRILEHVQWGRVVKASLQRPDGAGWRTVAVSSGFHLPIPWLIKKRVIRAIGPDA